MSDWKKCATCDNRQICKFYHSTISKNKEGCENWNGWIPVSEELPEDSMRFGGHRVCMVDVVYRFGGRLFVGQAYWDNDHFNGHGLAEVSDIVYWRPLHNLPEEEGQKNEGLCVRD